MKEKMTLQLQPIGQGCKSPAVRGIDGKDTGSRQVRLALVPLRIEYTVVLFRRHIKQILDLHPVRLPGQYIDGTCFGYSGF